MCSLDISHQFHPLLLLHSSLSLLATGCQFRCFLSLLLYPSCQFLCKDLKKKKQAHLLQMQQHAFGTELPVSLHLSLEKADVNPSGTVMSGSFSIPPLHMQQQISCHWYACFSTLVLHSEPFRHRDATFFLYPLFENAATSFSASIITKSSRELFCL